MTQLDGPLAGDDLTAALIPVALDLISAVHNLDREGVGRALGAAQWEASGPLTGLQALAVLLAGMCSEDHNAVAALGWTLDPERYADLRADGVPAEIASLRAARTQDRSHDTSLTAARTAANEAPEGAA